MKLHEQILHTLDEIDDALIRIYECFCVRLTFRRIFPGREGKNRD